MNMLMRGVLAVVVSAASTMAAALPYVNSVTVALLQLDSVEGANVQVGLQNNQPMTDCYFNVLRLPNANSDFHKQAYATLLTAKINGLVISQIMYSVVSPGNCEIRSVML